MDLSIEYNLPKFMFPDAFLASLPKDGEPVEPTEAEAAAYRRANLQVRGTLTDYIFCTSAERLRHGVLREVRKFGDGSVMVRFDVALGGSRNEHFSDLQFLMHLDASGRLQSYTQVYDDLKPSTSWSVFKCGSSVRRVMRTVDEVLADLDRTPEEELLVCAGKVSYRALRLVRRSTSSGDVYDIRYTFDHPPVAFQMRGQSHETLERLLGVFKEKGLRGLTREAGWEYWDGDTDPREQRRMGINMRLLFHRFVAEYKRDAETVERLDRLGIRDERLPFFWAPRVGDTWPEIVHNLYRLARDPSSPRKDAYDRPLTPLECDRLVAYAALEGDPEAKAEVA